MFRLAKHVPQFGQSKDRNQAGVALFGQFRTLPVGNLAIHRGVGPMPLPKLFGSRPAGRSVLTVGLKQKSRIGARFSARRFRVRVGRLFGVGYRGRMHGLTLTPNAAGLHFGL